jgi:cytosine/uracil/thiamine/allantoin permease
LVAKSVKAALAGANPAFSIAFQGDRHPTTQFKIMSIKSMVICYALFAAFMLFVVFIGTHQLDKATAVQCKQHDWPVKAHQVHMDWCVDNGYQVN